MALPGREQSVILIVVHLVENRENVLSHAQFDDGVKRVRNAESTNFADKSGLQVGERRQPNLHLAYEFDEVVLHFVRGWFDGCLG